jgi:DNA-binding CsgD family transcriptional regulator
VVADLPEGTPFKAASTCSGPMSTFAFLGKELERSFRAETLLCHFAPYLHEAMYRAMPIAYPAQTSKQPFLSRREIEVLNWAMAGKTNWEISMILHISEATVKFHVKNIMIKLRASSRTHAVAIALGQGLIRHTC